jgi:nucleoside-diphosphate-sugar epimerase
MRIALTGATGFLGRYIVRQLDADGHALRAWYRTPPGPHAPHARAGIEWLPGDLADPTAAAPLVAGCDAVVHAALDRPGAGFRGAEGDTLRFVERNVVGTLRLIEAARAAGVGRFVFISTCAVHERILDDHPLDETHPLWPTSHYGAHKAAIEAFVASYGLGHGFPICALRPTGIYGLAEPPGASKWHDLIAAVARGLDVNCRRGGKEVHAADVARAVCLLLDAPAGVIAGQAYNCYDRYIAEHEVATLARNLTHSASRIEGQAPTPRHQIETSKLRALGMTFGGRPLLEQTIADILATIPRA